MKMKKTISLLCCVIIVALGITLTGCGNSSDENSSAESSVESSSDENSEDLYLGTWAATDFVTSEGDVYDVEECYGPYEITFNANNTLLWLLNGDLSYGEWKLIEDGVRITDDTGEFANLTYKDGELLWEIVFEDISGVYHFVKNQ